MANVDRRGRRRLVRADAGAPALPLLPLSGPRSTAFNVDYWGAIIRSYYDGRETWLNTVERGADYAAGDLWGSVGAWFSGRWRTEPSLDYVQEVRRIRREKTWRREFFREGS